MNKQLDKHKNTIVGMILALSLFAVSLIAPDDIPKAIYTTGVVLVLAISFK